MAPCRRLPRQNHQEGFFVAGLGTFLGKDGEYVEVRRNGQTIGRMKGLHGTKGGDHYSSYPSEDVREGDTLLVPNRKLRVTRIDTRTERGRPYALVAFFERCS
jgi:hypothetical protein